MSTESAQRLPAYLSTHASADQIIFEDSMTGNWQDNWFLDGKEATLSNDEKGLYFASGDHTYPNPEHIKFEDRQEMSKHHAVLWTQQEFSGDLIISYECTRSDESAYGVNIIYVQAQGIGTEEFPKDIYAWRDFRNIAGMGKYYTYMNALHISYNVGDFTSPSYIRARRYPKNDPIGLKWGMTKIDPDYNDEGAKMLPGQTYIIEVEKTNDTLVFRTFDYESKALLKECSWDTTQIHELMEPKRITEGRIGFRQMSTKQNIYKNFKVIRK
ncbi:MAG TPA: hypothetical protein DCX06_04065 [Opitutae bacterium]|nr:hypothetical protein [Opitutae bacterium]